MKSGLITINLVDGLDGAHGGHTGIHPRIDPKPIKMAWSRLANVLRQLIFLTLLCTLGIVFAGVTFWSESIAIAQMHNMTMSSSSPKFVYPHQEDQFFSHWSNKLTDHYCSTE